MIRVAVFLLLVALTACSSAREISVQASEIQDRANAIVRTTERMDASSEDVQHIRSNAEAISHSVSVIHREVTGVKDVVPWWASALQWALIAAAIAGVAVIVWQTGIGVALRAAFGLIPKRVQTEARLAADTLNPARAETVREWVSMRRSTDPLFDASFRAAQEKTP